MMIMYVIRALVLLYLLLTWTTIGAYQPFNFTEMKPTTTSSGSTFRYPVYGNVYPLGHLTTIIAISNGDQPKPPKPYDVDIDTGSDLTWVACAGATPLPSNPYSPREEDIIKCQDPECASLGKSVGNDCTSPSNDPCRYTVSYADGSEYKGVLVRGLFPFRLSNDKIIWPRLIFGCATHSDIPEDPVHQTIPDGLLGLGKGNLGILKQLRGMGVIPSVAAHCFSPQGGGSLFIGDIPAFSGVTWKQLEKSDVSPHYFLGSADILFDGQVTDIKGLEMTIDSGSTYTYLISLAYQALLDLVTKNLNGSPLTVAADDKALPICWRGSTPIESYDDQVFGYFKPLALNFTGEQNVQFEMLPKSYLIISEKKNVCFGILDAQVDGLEEGVNLIGDISMHDKFVIYDNENGRVGWGIVKCPSIRRS